MSSLAELGVDPDNIGTWLGSILANTGEMETALSIANDRARTIHEMASNILEHEDEMLDVGGFAELVKATKAIQKFSRYIHDRSTEAEEAVEGVSAGTSLALEEFGFLRRAGAL